MQINLNPDEEQIIKDALQVYSKDLVGRGEQYNTIVNILNKINQSGLMQLQRTPNIFLQKEYLFFFEEGGWHTVWAKTIRGAAKIAIQKFEDIEDLNPQLDSLQIATKESMISAFSLFQENTLDTLKNNNVIKPL
jgi:hypothetical protein